MRRNSPTKEGETRRLCGSKKSALLVGNLRPRLAQWCKPACSGPVEFTPYFKVWSNTQPNLEYVGRAVFFSGRRPEFTRDPNGFGYVRVSRTMPTPRVASDASTIINQVHLSDPAEDAVREAQRNAEAGLHVVGSAGVDGSRVTPKRQDFSNERATKKDTRLGDYILGQTLGEGEFGKVKMGWKKQGGAQVAIKLIRREKLDNPARLQKVYREISILQQLDHPNIVRLHEMVETERTIGIILEYASGGELFDYILHNRYLRDNSARRLFAQLVSGVGYLHKKGIIHRDLKLENLMLDRNKNIIITDFGFANTFDPNDELGEKVESRLHRRSFVKKYNLEAIQPNGFRRGDLMATSCGSPCYAAPELVVSDSIYTGRKVDVWSCGVILYAMLAGYLPFDDDPANPEGDNINLLYKYIVNTPLVFPEYVTPHARDILRRILVPDPRKRADLFEIARHSWLTEYAHIVEFITSGTTTNADISNATVSSDGQHGTPESKLSRSASVREPVKPLQPVAPISGLLAKHATIERSEENQKQTQTPRNAKRRTVQVEYVEPQTQTARSPTSPTGEVSTAGVSAAEPNAAFEHTTTRATAGSEHQEKAAHQQPLAPPTSRDYHRPISSSQHPTRPGRDVPRSISDSNAFTTAPNTRPSTQGSMGGGSRLPSRGSYGQPAAATVATTNAQGRFSQPKPYAITGSFGQPEAVNGDAAGSPSTVASSYQQQSVVGPNKQRGHKRSSTLTNLGERLFGRSNSTRRSTEQRQKNDRAYPPTSMKPVQAETGPRKSTDSRRSFGFSRKNSDLAGKEKRTSRRFSLIPRWGSSNHADSPPSESTADEPTTPNAIQSNPNLYTTSPNTYDGASNYPYRYQSDRYRENAAAQKQPPIHSAPNFYSTPQPAGRTAAPKPTSTSAEYATKAYPEYPSPNSFGGNTSPSAQREAYQEKYTPYTGQQQQAAANVQPSHSLKRANRRFEEAYEQEDAGHGGSSGAARKVMDFFRRRGKARDNY